MSTAGSGVRKVGNAALPEQRARLRAPASSPIQQVSSGLWLRPGALDHRARRPRRLGHRLRGEDRQHAVDARRPRDRHRVRRRSAPASASPIRSIGLPCDQFGGSACFSASSVAARQLGERDAEVGGAVGGHHARAAAVGDRSPAGCRAGAPGASSACAAANSWPMVFTRTTPARRTAASKTSSAPTSAPVCDIAAREPAGWRPDLHQQSPASRAPRRAARS